MDNGENNDINELGTCGYCSPATLDLPNGVPIPNFRHDHDVYNKYPSPLFDLMGNRTLMMMWYIMQTKQRQ